jgi:phosphatidylethanolamine-binding protein (PEBP) family uncharacterized protein
VLGGALVLAVAGCGDDEQPSEGPPAAEESMVEDPDVGNFVHWKLLGLPPAATGVDEGTDPDKDSGWEGPCPPEGDDPHRYVFTIYATDALLGVDDDADIDDVHAGLDDHALARGTLTGRFGR